jgi:GT2 family glycosyltransferase
MMTGVVIGTRANPGLVVDAVRSVLAGTLLPDELIVVDQSNPVDSAVLALEALHPIVRVIESTSVGLSSARNEGVRASTVDAVVFTDDDVLVDPRWLEQIVAGLELAGPRAVATGRVLAGSPEVPGGTALSLATDPAPRVFEGQIRRDPLSGNSMAIPRTAFAECGYFDELLGPGGAFNSADDNDFGYRLLRAGYRIHYIPDAVVYHRARRAGRELAKVNWDYGRGQGAFLAKHTLRGDHWTRSRFRTTLRFWATRWACRPLRERTIRGHGELTYVLAFLSAAVQWWLQALPSLLRRRSA